MQSDNLLQLRCCRHALRCRLCQSCQRERNPYDSVTRILRLDHCPLATQFLFEVKVAVLRSQLNVSKIARNGYYMQQFTLVKFIYSEKATKFCKISTVNSTVVLAVTTQYKSKVVISQIFCVLLNIIESILSKDRQVVGVHFFTDYMTTFQ